tara:strand:+ start:731 stop:877 length:147 start_codon:yes stop_codon:yes gene_type:complete
MKKFKVFLNGYITYIVDEEDRALALAEDDIKYLHPNFNIDISGVREEE